MKDSRYVDELDVEELERILLIKRREARLARLRQIDRLDEVRGRDPIEPVPPSSAPPPVPTVHHQYQGVGASASYHSVEVENGRQGRLWALLMRWLTVPFNVNWRYVSNKVLLVIEMAAVVGLAAIVINTWQTREEISEDAEALVLPPTPVPTAIPVINAVLLPAGHTAPDARGFSLPEPIPADLKSLAAMITPEPIPIRGPEHPTRIVIPSIGVDHPVVMGDDWEALKQGVGHTPWSVNPGAKGNCVLSAYNDIFGAIFRRLPEMELGDEIFVHANNQIYRYVVKATHVVEPTQVELMNTTRQPVLTLISSYPYLVDNMRIVVIAELDPRDLELGGEGS